MSGSRWTDRDDVARGADYDERFAQLAAEGADVHGEAALVADLAEGPTVLDAGCGTGRVAIELDRRGLRVTGVDIDPAMLEAARAKAPGLTWVEADLAALDLGATFDTIVAAGNVLIFVASGSEPRVLDHLARHLRPGGRLIAGFSVDSATYTPEQFDIDATAAGLTLEDRWSTWSGDPWSPGDTYQVSVHRRADPT